MREIKVIYYVDDAEMINGEKPHSEEYESEIVEAGSSQEAIDLVMDFLIDQANQSEGISAEKDGDKINIFDEDGEIVEQYYNFSTESPVKKLREELGLSRAETARIFEMPIRTLEDWEYGKCIPSHWVEKLVIEKLEKMMIEK